MAASSTKARRVICLSTGQVYNSINAAAREHDVAACSMLRAIRNDKRCAGKFFAFVPADLAEEQLDKWRMARLLGCVSYVVRLGSSADSSEDSAPATVSELEGMNETID